MEEGTVTPWLESFLSTQFFSICSRHADAPRSERNMFCFDCNYEAFCFYCRSSSHSGHRVVQIRRSSYHDVVRVTEIQKVLDINEVQTYVINSARVLFLNERPQPKMASNKGVSHVCEVCKRTLLDPFRFCSLGCKVAGIKKKRGYKVDLIHKNDDEGKRRKLAYKEGGEKEQEMESRDSQQYVCDDKYSPNKSGRIHSQSRRKGIPHRAPLVS